MRPAQAPWCVLGQPGYLTQVFRPATFTCSVLKKGNTIVRLDLSWMELFLMVLIPHLITKQNCQGEFLAVKVVSSDLEGTACGWSLEFSL